MTTSNSDPLTQNVNDVGDDQSIASYMRSEKRPFE